MLPTPCREKPPLKKTIAVIFLKKNTGHVKLIFCVQILRTCIHLCAKHESFYDKTCGQEDFPQTTMTQDGGVRQRQR